MNIHIHSYTYIHMYTHVYIYIYIYIYSYTSPLSRWVVCPSLTPPFHVRSQKTRLLGPGGRNCLANKVPLRVVLRVVGPASIETPRCGLYPMKFARIWPGIKALVLSLHTQMNGWSQCALLRRTHGTSGSKPREFGAMVQPPPASWIGFIMANG